MAGRILQHHVSGPAQNPGDIRMSESHNNLRIELLQCAREVRQAVDGHIRRILPRIESAVGVQLNPSRALSRKPLCSDDVKRIAGNQPDRLRRYACCNCQLLIHRRVGLESPHAIHADDLAKPVKDRRVLQQASDSTLGPIGEGYQRVTLFRQIAKRIRHIWISRQTPILIQQPALVFAGKRHAQTMAYIGLWPGGQTSKSASCACSARRMAYSICLLRHNSATALAWPP